METEDKQLSRQSKQHVQRPRNSLTARPGTAQVANSLFELSFAMKGWDPYQVVAPGGFAKESTKHSMDTSGKY